METKMAPTYATLTAAFLEENLHEIIGKKYNENIKREFTKSWKTYLDDSFIFWNCTWGNIDNLHNILQRLHPKIKFTMEYSFKELPFFDMHIKNENGEIITDIYHKPTDTQQYFHFNRYHPQNCLKSIPYTLAWKICTIIANKKLRKFHLKELYIKLHQRGYPKTLISKGIAEKIPLKELRSHKKHNSEKLLTYL